MNTLIIAEAGVNHNGDLDIARQLIDIAADAGADMVKFQTFSAERLVTSYAKKAEYQIQSTETSESQHAMLCRLELTQAMHEELMNHCICRGIEFFSTGFDIESLDLLDKLGLHTIKIPSGEITNFPYLRHVGRYNKHVLMSTGMSTLGEIESALDVIEQSGTPRERITLLHCNTEYPTPMSDVNLRAMLTLRNAFGVPVGYSDHTLGTEVPIAAVALGATVIEKHFTLSRNMSGPDHKASLEPVELKAMVNAIRNIECALGDGLKKPTASEAKNKSISRKSLVAAQAIRAGDIFSEANIVAKRPGIGLSPMRWSEVINRKSPRDFAIDELIEL